MCLQIKLCDRHERLIGEVLMHDEALYKSTFTFTLPIPSLVIVILMVWFYRADMLYGRHTQIHTDSQTPLNALLPRVSAA